MTLRYNDNSPAIEGYRAGQQIGAADQVADARDFDLSQARKRDAEETAASRALEQVFARQQQARAPIVVDTQEPSPQGSRMQVARPRQPVTARDHAAAWDEAAAAPGLGAGTRLRLSTQAAQVDNRANALDDRRISVEARARDRMAQDFKLGLEIGRKDGSFELAKDAARRMGVTVPESFWTDAAAQAKLHRELEMETMRARQEYYRRPPRPQADRFETDADGNATGVWNPETRQFDRVTRSDGTPAGRLAGRGGAAGGGKPSVYREKYDGWLALHPGDQQGALNFAGNRDRPASPQEEMRIASAIADREARAELVAPGGEWVRKRTQEIIGGWRTDRASAAPPVAAPAPADGGFVRQPEGGAAPAPAPSPVAPGRSGSLQRPDLEAMADKIAAEVGVRPEVLRAIVQAESGWNPGALSPDGGARGLTQMRRPAAQDMGVAWNMLDGPALALRSGAGYYKRQLDRYGGDERRAAHAYRWGAGKPYDPAAALPYNVAFVGGQQMRQPAPNITAASPPALTSGPQVASAAASPQPVDPTAERARAMSAIQRGKNPDDVRRLYAQRTGAQPDF